MAKRKRSNRILANGRDNAEQYFSMGYRTAQSPAWRSLSGPAAKVWVELRSRFNGRNNGRLHLSLEEGAHLLGLGKTTVHRALKELEEKGFIRKTRQGQFYGRLASEYALTSERIDGHNATCDWKRWSPRKRRIVEFPKQKRGPDTGHIATLTGPDKERKNCSRPTTKPVNGAQSNPKGPETERL